MEGLKTPVLQESDMGLPRTWFRVVFWGSYCGSPATTHSVCTYDVNMDHAFLRLRILGYEVHELVKLSFKSINFRNQ